MTLLQKIKNRSQTYLIASAILHLFFVVAINLPDPQPPVEQAVEVNFESEPVSQPVKSKTKAQPPAIKNQVVEQMEKQLNDEIPEETRFLSRHNQVVKKQTRARETGAFTNTAENAQAVAGSLSGQKEKSKTVDQTHGDLPRLADLKPQFSQTPQAFNDSVKNPGKPSQTDDYIKDVNIGIQTLLSAREFVYYSYYQRIKEQLRQHWEPTVREKVKIMVRKGRALASSNDRMTQVMIILNSNGDLERVDVLGQSGVQDLDDAAVEAFRKSAPFPHPPKGIVESDGRIRIRWDFILEA